MSERSCKRIRFAYTLCYPGTYGYEPEDLPFACWEYRREISLPIYSKMGAEDVDDVIARSVRWPRSHHKEQQCLNTFT